MLWLLMSHIGLLALFSHSRAAEAAKAARLAACACATCACRGSRGRPRPLSRSLQRAQQPGEIAVGSNGLRQTSG